MGLKGQGPTDARREALQSYHLEEPRQGSHWVGVSSACLPGPVAAGSDTCDTLDLPRCSRGWNEFTVLCPMGQVSPGGRASSLCLIRLLPQFPNWNRQPACGLCPASLCQSFPVQLGSGSRTNKSAALGQTEKEAVHPRRVLARAHLPTWTPAGGRLVVSLGLDASHIPYAPGLLEVSGRGLLNSKISQWSPKISPWRVQPEGGAVGWRTSGGVRGWGWAGGQYPAAAGSNAPRPGQDSPGSGQDSPGSRV